MDFPRENDSLNDRFARKDKWFFWKLSPKTKKNNLFTSLADEIKNKIQNEGKNDDFKQYRKKLHYVFNFI